MVLLVERRRTGRTGRVIYRFVKHGCCRKKSQGGGQFTFFHAPVGQLQRVIKNHIHPFFFYLPLMFSFCMKLLSLLSHECVTDKIMGLKNGSDTSSSGKSMRKIYIKRTHQSYKISLLRRM